MAEIVFALGSYTSRSVQLSAQRTVNCFVEKQEPGAKSQTPLFGSPGLTSWVTLPKSPVRWMWNWKGVLHAVAGDTLYSIASDKTVTALGSGITGTTPVRMSDNGDQLIVINGTGGWVYTASTLTWTAISSPFFYPCKTVICFDDYFVFEKAGTNEFFISALLDGLTYSSLDFASAEAVSDILEGVAGNLQMLWLFGQKHIENWYDTGSASFPFQRYAGGVVNRGTLAPHSLVLEDDALFFLGSDGVFYRLQGNVPIRMSNHGVETAIAGYGDISDAECFSYTLEGHKMVHLNFPSVPASWVFDISTKEWHERESLDSNAVSLGRWRGNCATQIYDKIMIGDAYTGDISYLDWNAYTELTNPMFMLAHSAPIHSDKLKVFIDRLELDFQTGVGLNAGQGSSPEVMLRYSRDGGETWSNVQPVRGIGEIGNFIKRQRWLSLGAAYVWVFEIRISDPVRRVLIGTHLDASIGMR